MTRVYKHIILLITVYCYFKTKHVFRISQAIHLAILKQIFLKIYDPIVNDYNVH